MSRWLWSLLCLSLSIFAPPIAADDVPPLYFNEKDVYHVTCWPVDINVGTPAAKAAAKKLRDVGYEYFGTLNVAYLAEEPCMNWRKVITERTEVTEGGKVLKDEGFVKTGVPSMDPPINAEYYADHTQCRWLPMHSGERIATEAPVVADQSGQALQERRSVRAADDSPPDQEVQPIAVDTPADDRKPASGPWCYTQSAGTGPPTPTRCLKACGDTYETTWKRKQVPRKAIVPQPKINHNKPFTEQLGSAFVVEAAQRAMIFVKPSMENHNEELLATKRIVFYSCCGVVGAVILWIAACHFLGLRVKRRRMAIVEIQRQAISASITRHRRESEQEHEEEDAKQA